jgi:aspartyl-tRNA(Asn)/glutamyl-tRNA(Gln) amidotransferase subunit B
MQMGHMRFEPNINLHITSDGKTVKTPIVEVKNLNSFRALERTVAYEIERQLAAWREDPDGYTMEKLGKQNRGYDDVRGVTVFQREKEEAHDYRYFPEPDLVPLVVDDAWRQAIVSTIGELPLARRARYMSAYGLTFKEADALTQDPETGDFFDAAVRSSNAPKRCAILLLGTWSAHANEKNCTIAKALKAARVSPDQLGSLAQMVESGWATSTAVSAISTHMATHQTGEDPRNLAELMGLTTVREESQIEQWVDQAIAANPQAVADVKEGGKKQQKAFGFLTGQVMQLSRGAAAPAEVQRLLHQKLGG